MKKPICVFLNLAKQFLKALRLEAPTICLSSLYHLLTTLFEKTCFQQSRVHLVLLNLRLCPLVPLSFLILKPYNWLSLRDLKYLKTRTVIFENHNHLTNLTRVFKQGNKKLWRKSFDIFNKSILEWSSFHMVSKYRQCVLSFCDKARVWRTGRQTDGLDGGTELRCPIAASRGKSEWNKAKMRCNIISRFLHV